MARVTSHGWFQPPSGLYTIPDGWLKSLEVIVRLSLQVTKHISLVEICFRPYFAELTAWHLTRPSCELVFSDQLEALRASNWSARIELAAWVFNNPSCKLENTNKNVFSILIYSVFVLDASLRVQNENWAFREPIRSNRMGSKIGRNVRSHVPTYQKYNQT